MNTLNSEEVFFESLPISDKEKQSIIDMAFMFAEIAYESYLNQKKYEQIKVGRSAEVL